MWKELEDRDQMSGDREQKPETSNLEQVLSFKYQVLNNNSLWNPLTDHLVYITLSFFPSVSMPETTQHI